MGEHVGDITTEGQGALDHPSIAGMGAQFLRPAYSMKATHIIVKKITISLCYLQQRPLLTTSRARMSYILVTSIPLTKVIYY
jgi:hypothetical protein